jgi:glycosyltransferase involved in cell wall biosynthesis
MKKIIVSVTNDLVTDQRVQRICHSLNQLGYSVVLVGRRLPGTIVIDVPYPCKLIKLFFNKNFLFYAEFNLRLFLFLLLSKADILLANDLDTLPANFLASKIKRKTLVFDSHEYFSETPEVYKRGFVRKFWLFLEKLTIKRCDAYYTVSQSVANIYKEKYNIDFEVIRNVPFQNIEQQIQSDPDLIIYQGAVNEGRGLELMLQAMAISPQLRFLIVGDGPELQKIKSLAAFYKVDERATFTGRLLPHELKAITPKASVGISIEEPLGMSYLAALPNKLFDYIQAGIPVIVSDFPEMKNLVTQYNVGLVLEDRSPEGLSKVLNFMLNNKQQRNIWKENLKNAAKELCWEKESLKLKAIFSSL